MAGERRRLLDKSTVVNYCSLAEYNHASWAPHTLRVSPQPQVTLQVNYVKSFRPLWSVVLCHLFKDSYLGN
jgi:hypothetical protein